MTTLRNVLKIQNDAKQLSLVRKTVSEVLAASPFGVQDRNKIILAVDEAVANVVEHAYGGASGDIEIALTLDEVTFNVHVRDNGVKFDLSEVPALDIASLIKNGAKGGYGLLLMKKIMDDVRYSLQSSFVNELIMTKKVPQPQPGAKQG